MLHGDLTQEESLESSEAGRRCEAHLQFTWTGSQTRSKVSFLPYSLGALAFLSLAAYAFARLAPALTNESQSLDFEVKSEVKSEDWEKIPGIELAISKAQSMRPPAHLRSLNDIFYASQPEEVPWVKAECVLDSVQAMAYLGEAISFLYRAIDSRERACPDSTPAGCAMSVAGFITSMSWLGSFLALAANACGEAINSAALCTGDWTALMANFAELATAGAAIHQDCGDDLQKLNVKKVLLKEEGEEEAPHWRQFVPAGAGPTVDKVLKVQEHQKAQREINMDYFQCSMDVTNAASFLVRAALQIRAGTRACYNPEACAIDVLNVISSFFAVGQFTALAVADCTPVGWEHAECGGDILDILVDLTNGPAAGLATVSDCKRIANEEVEVETLPRD